MVSLERVYQSAFCGGPQNDQQDVQTQDKLQIAGRVCPPVCKGNFTERQLQGRRLIQLLNWNHCRSRGAGFGAVDMICSRTSHCSTDS